MKSVENTAMLRVFFGDDGFGTKAERLQRRVGLGVWGFRV